MRFTDYLASAFRHTRRQKLRSGLTIFAVVIGATSVTIMLTLVTSAKAFFVQQFDASGQLKQVVVTQETDLSYRDARNRGGSNSDGVKLTNGLADQITAFPHVTAVAGVVNPYQVAAIVSGDKKLRTEQVIGYRADGVIEPTVVAGRNLAPRDGVGAITVTKSYAEKLGFGDGKALVGKDVTLLTQPGYTGEGATIAPPSQSPGAQTKPEDQAPTSLPATVVGVVTSDDAQYALYVPLSWAEGLMTERHYEMAQGDPQKLGSQPPQPTLVTRNMLDEKGYTRLVVEVDSQENAGAVAKQIKTLGVGAVGAEQYLHEQLTVFNILGIVLGGIGLIALVVATIGVVNTMVMSVLERTREIGVIRACGGTRRAVRRLFTSEAAFLGLLGGVGGVVIAYGLSVVANAIVNQQLVDNGIRASNIIAVPIWLAIAVIGGTTLIGMMAGMGPATRAARLNPVDALRYE